MANALGPLRVTTRRRPQQVSLYLSATTYAVRTLGALGVIAITAYTTVWWWAVVAGVVIALYSRRSSSIGG